MWMKDCDQCSTAKLGGLQVWMQHLTNEHAIPTEWPSDRAARLTGANALRPYTTIAESKKKRRKDSIPRPLNSFMLFAQHIRRNVLRVFSDASNSVISQQLGDLWRTVPRSCRNQYDDEANRLVKIHQIEFPNYKYQPKKRQIMTSTNSDHLRTTTLNQNHDNTIHIHTQSSGLSVNKREDQLTTNKLLSSSLLRTSTDYNVYSTTVTNKLPSSIRNCSVPSTLSINNSSVRKQVNNMIDVNSQRNGSTDLMNTLVTSPSKLPCNTVYTKLEPKSLNVNTISNNNSGSNITTNNTTNGSQTMSFKSTSHGSLSSVLPPLLTLSHNHPHYNQQQQQQQQHTSVLIEQIPIGICDSAYASGINSSSSSSASSPAVGELISPAKSCSSTFSSSLCMKQNKTSPVRRKIHFIPIRPQSQQLPPVGSQPTRQRFLSANNGNNNNGVPTGGCIQSNGFQFKSNSESVLPSRITNDLHIQQQQQQLKEEMNETILLQDSEMLATTTDILTPVYIQLDNEGQSPTEGLMFTLPPGTALIQTCNDNIGRIPLNTTPRRFYITNGSRIIPAISKSVQVLQPLKVMNVIHHHHQQQQQQQQQLQHHSTSSSYTDPIICSPMMSSELLSSSSSYSCNSSPNSIVSPLSNDVFLPMQQVEMIMPTTTNSYHHNHQSSTCMDVYQFDGENHLDMCIEEEIIIDEDKMNAKHLDTMTNIISLDECMDTVNDSFNTTSSSGVIHEWSSNLPLNDSIIMTPSSSSVLTSTVSSSMKPITLSSTITTMNNSVDEEEIEGNRLVVSNQHLPLTINVMKSTNDSLITLSSTSSSSTVTTNLDHHYHHHHHHHLQEQQQQHHDHQNNITIDNDLTDTDFSITNDTDNFDSSFDAMMNSIDITTFLPGTFQTNVEVEGEDEEEVEEEHGKHCIDNDFDNELTHQSLQLVSYSNNNNNDNNNNNHHDNHLIKIDEFNDSCHEIIDSGTSIESSFINNDNQSQLYKVIRSDIDFINNQYPTSRLVTSLHKVHKYSSPTSIQTSIKSTSSLRMNSLHELLTNTPQVYSSTLADLDSLDKSSLFIIKPEWSVLA